MTISCSHILSLLYSFFCPFRPYIEARWLGFFPRVAHLHSALTAKTTQRRWQSPISSLHDNSLRFSVLFSYSLVGVRLNSMICHDTTYVWNFPHFSLMWLLSRWLRFAVCVMFSFLFAGHQLWVIGCNHKFMWTRAVLQQQLSSIIISNIDFNETSQHCRGVMWELINFTSLFHHQSDVECH